MPEASPERNSASFVRPTSVITHDWSNQNAASPALSAYGPTEYNRAEHTGYSGVRAKSKAFQLKTTVTFCAHALALLTLSPYCGILKASSRNDVLFFFFKGFMPVGSEINMSPALLKRKHLI